MMAVIRIAAVITCHNRRTGTLSCLNTIISQQAIEDVSLHIYLVDDGSTDGTGEAVLRQISSVTLLKGNGNLYWCGGMRKAFQKALKSDYDYYLWLNDDTMLYPNALRVMLDTSQLLARSEGKSSIVAASLQDPQTKCSSYGGLIRSSRWDPLQFVPISPTNQPRACDTINGNCVLIPRKIAEAVGNLSPDFTHQLGDFDYGLRARSMGFSCWLAPGYSGTCKKNHKQKLLTDSSLPVKKRLQNMSHPTVLPPVKEWMRFTRRHGGIVWPIYWIRTLIRACCPLLWVLLRKK